MSNTRRARPFEDMDVRTASQRRSAQRLPFFITRHAVERFRERFCPGYSYAAAFTEAKALAMMAGRTEVRTYTDDEVWRAGEVRFVVRVERTGRTALTVLPKDAREDEEPEMRMELRGLARLEA